MPEQLFTQLMQAGVKIIDAVVSVDIQPSNMLTRRPSKVVARVRAIQGHRPVEYRITVQEWVEPEVEEDELGKRL